MKKKIKIAICGINPYSGNRGVGALAISTFYLLNQIAKDSGYQFEITTINPIYRKYSINLENDNIDITSVLPISVFSFTEILRLVTSPKRIISFLRYFSYDCLLCMGEGDSFSDIYGKKRFESINNQHRIAKLFKKKYLLLPQTIGPFKDLHIRKKANKSIEGAQIVFARDLQSFNYIVQNTNQKNVFESIDVAFFMPYKRHQFPGDYIQVGLNISALLWNGGYTRDNQFGLKCNYQKLVHNIIHYFLSLPNVKVHLVPHVVLADSDLENDYEVSFNLAKEYENDRIVLSPFFLNPIIAKSYIAGLDFFAGARMHSTIAAFSSGVPVFPMAYSRKFNGLFIDTLDYKYIGDMINSEMDVIICDIQIAFETRKVLAEIIQSKMDIVVNEKKRSLITKLSEVLGLTKIEK